MKYIKTFEKKESKFKVGDYVVAEYDKSYTISEYIKTTTTQISNVETRFEWSDGGWQVDPNSEKYVYTVNYPDIPKIISNTTKYHFLDDDLRLATPEEIEDYKMKNNMKKYNL